MSISKFSKCGNIPETIASGSICASGSTILCTHGYGNSIHKFDMDEEKYKWEEWAKRPGGWGDRHHQLLKNQHTIFMYGNNSLHCIAGDEQQTWQTKLDVIEHTLFMVNNSIHCIGGDELNVHREWNPNKGEFDNIHQFDEYKYIRNGAAVYNPTTKLIVLIGGLADFTNRKFVDSIWVCPVKNGKPLKWTKTKTKFAKTGAQVVVAGAEIIIAGGYSPAGSYSDEIYIFNTETYVLRKSAIRCPKSEPLHLVKTGTENHESLICGYVRALYKTDDFRDMKLVSLSVIKMIGTFHSRVMVHWISKERRFGAFNDTDEDGSSGRYEHYMIPLKDIVTQ